MKKRYIVLGLYLLIISIPANYFEFEPLKEWRINTVVLLLFTSFFVVTSIKKYKIIKIIIYVFSIWVVHFLLTIPASYILGILIKDPNHIRTIAEHRSVFLLASLPIFIYLMNLSKYFYEGTYE